MIKGGEGNDIGFVHLESDALRETGGKFYTCFKIPKSQLTEANLVQGTSGQLWQIQESI